MGCNHLNSATKTITLRKQYFDINHVPNAMKNRIILVILCWGIQLVNFAQSKMDPSTYLWYATPAKKWEEAIPVGNGRLGAMIFGKYGEERIQLNESTYWSGGPYSTVVKNGYKSLSTIQKLVFDGKYLDAHNLFGRNLMGYPVEQQKYQSLANLILFFPGQDSVSQYKRDLDLTTGISSVSYVVNGIHFKREIYASHPHELIVIRITSDQKNSISLKANLRGVRNQTHSNYATDYFRMDVWGNDGLQLAGKSADYMGVKGQLKYKAFLKSVCVGGKTSTQGVDLNITNADTVTLYFSAATNFINYKNVSGNENAKALQYITAIKNVSYTSILKNTLKDYKKYFDRVSLKLPTTAQSFLPTNERLQKIQSSPDPSMAALSYQFGRYLMIASSRSKGQPANLQGLWNDDMNPSWDAKYTTNINTEMNYWPVESGNLSESAEPLIQMVKELQDQGSQVAKEHYGARGWVLHQNTDLWRVAAPMDGPTWGTFTVGGAWLCTHLWEHYQYTQDKKYLKEIYPVLKGAVQFFMDYLVPHPNGKWLVTNPSTSPENFPDGGGNKPYFDEVTAGFREGTTICAGSSIDMQILHDLFGYFSEASNTLQISDPFIDKVKKARSKLVPPQIGKDGSLQEWTEDWKSLEKNHRHFSHLYGLYPGKILTQYKSPAFIESFKNVLNERGDGAMGFSRAWKMALWSRLNDGERAYKIYQGYLKDQSCTSLFALCGKAPQVDGTFGVTAAITEMLMQSHQGYIELLPALPNNWNEGKLNGVCARGAFELNFSWSQQKINTLEILSKAGLDCRLQWDKNCIILEEGKTIPFTKQNNIITFKTEKGKTYQIQTL